MALPQCTITDTLYLPSGAISPYGKMVVVRASVTGEVVQRSPQTFTADADGAITFTVPRGGIVWLWANATGYDEFGPRGVRYSVPDQASGTLDDLTLLDDITVSGGAATWGSITGTLSSQTDLQAALDAKQNLDTDLTVIAGLTPSNDDFLQRKAGAWANRTIAQVKTDLGLSGTNSGDQTITLSGDVSGSGTGAITATLATVNASPGSFGAASKTLTATVNAKGLVTALAETSIAIAASQVSSGTFGIARGGTGLSTIASGKLLYASALDTLAELTLAATFGITTGTLDIANGGITNAMLAGSIAYSKLSLTGAILNADLAGSIANNKLANSAITIAGTSTSLGGSITASAILDSLGSTQGQIAYRGASGWVVLNPGTSGQVLQSGGAAANPSWTTISSGTTYNESNPILDSSSNELLKFTKVASAVNEFTISNNATGSAPELQVSGGDTNTGMVLAPKGTGAVSIWTPNGSAGLVVESGTYGSKFASTYRLEIANNTGDTTFTKYGGQNLNFAGGGATRTTVSNNLYAHFSFRTAFSLQQYTPGALTGNTDNWDNVTNWERQPFWRVSANSAVDLTGLVSTNLTDNAVIFFVNVGANTITLKNESASSTAANRFTTTTGADLALSQNKMAMLWYDTTSARWRVVLLP